MRSIIIAVALLGSTIAATAAQADEFPSALWGTWGSSKAVCTKLEATGSRGRLSEGDGCFRIEGGTMATEVKSDYRPEIRITGRNQAEIKAHYLESVRSWQWERYKLIRPGVLDVGLTDARASSQYVLCQGIPPAVEAVKAVRSEKFEQYGHWTDDLIKCQWKDEDYGSIKFTDGAMSTFGEDELPALCLYDRVQRNGNVWTLKFDCMVEGRRKPWKPTMVFTVINRNTMRLNGKYTFTFHRCPR